MCALVNLSHDEKKKNYSYNARNKAIEEDLNFILVRPWSQMPPGSKYVNFTRKT